MSARRLFMTLWLRSKRLYKKPLFIILLISILAVAMLSSYILSLPASVLRVAMVNISSPTAEELANAMGSAESMVDYAVMAKEEAEIALRSGKIDGIWDFGEDFDSALYDFVRGGKAPIGVTLGKSSVFASLAAERMYAELYPALSRLYFDRWVEEELGGEAREYYEDRVKGGSLVNFVYLDREEAEDESFLLSPLRGILAVLIALAAIASVMEFLMEAESGKHDNLPRKARPVMMAICAFAGGGNLALFALPAIALTGMWSGWREVAAMVLYLLALTAFASLLGSLLRRSGTLAAALPVIIGAMLALSPIFLAFELPIISSLLPTTHYLGGIYSSADLVYLGIYTAVCGGAMVLREALQARV